MPFLRATQRHFAAVADDALDARRRRRIMAIMSAALTIMAVSLAFAATIVAAGAQGRPRSRRGKM